MLHLQQWIQTIHSEMFLFELMTPVGYKNILILTYKLDDCSRPTFEEKKQMSWKYHLNVACHKFTRFPLTLNSHFVNVLNKIWKKKIKI